VLSAAPDDVRMPDSAERTHSAAGTTGAPPLAFPSFAVDPAAWFEYVDGLLETDPRAVLSAPPENWTDPAGHVWQVLATADGPEARPALQSPFLRQGGLPRISALLVTPEQLVVELAMHDWHQVVNLPIGTIAVRDLGLAMLTRLELPHEGLERVAREVWDAASRRWVRSRSSSQVAIAVEGRSAHG
jgi:hypothetical protein